MLCHPLLQVVVHTAGDYEHREVFERKVTEMCRWPHTDETSGDF